MSTNGIFINGHRLHKSAAIIMDGDEIEVPGHTSTCIDDSLLLTYNFPALMILLVFSCVHSLKGSCERVSIFEPTPPQGCYKVYSIYEYVFNELAHHIWKDSEDWLLWCDVSLSRKVWGIFTYWSYYLLISKKWKFCFCTFVIWFIIFQTSCLQNNSG